MNKFCTNCGNKLELNVIKCSNCGTAIIDDSDVKSSNIIKKIFSTIIFVIVAIITIFVCIELYQRSQVESYLKNALSDYQYDLNYQSSGRCNGVCKGSCDGTCTAYEKIPGCYVYYYEVILDQKDTFNVSVNYEKGLGVSQNNIHGILDDYEKLNDYFKNILNLDNITINSTSKEYQIYLPVKLADNLHKDFFGKIIPYFKYPKFNNNKITSLDLYFSDNFSVSIYENDMYAYYNKNNNHSAISLHVDIDTAEKAIEGLTPWVLRYS